MQNVYHLSQYAAVRSFSAIDIKEVRTICNLLDDLVINDILDSDLDRTTDSPNVFKTLTRQYSLGNSNHSKYEDDAYYPLVVRSIAGLLSRTIDEIGKKSLWADTSELIKEFRRVLKFHFDKMIARRPKKDDQDPGLQKLWSIAANEPYYLYATQRTIFALLCYAEFIDKTGKVKPGDGGGADQKLATDISDVLARAFADTLMGKVGAEIIRLARSADAAQPKEPTPQAPPLPTPTWASKAILAWLAELDVAMKDNQLDDFLQSRAQIIVDLRTKAEELKVGKDMVAKTAKELWNELEKNPLLADAAYTTANDLVPILFERFLRDMMKPAELVETWKAKESALEKLIKSITKKNDILKNSGNNP